MSIETHAGQPTDHTSAHGTRGEHAAQGDRRAHTGQAAHAAHAGHGDQAAHANHAAPAHGDHTAHGDHAAHAAHGGGVPGGLLISQDGYTIDLAETIIRPGEFDFRFRILGPDGRAVTEYGDLHDRELHLIVAKRELTGFWHVHPVRDADGIWSVRLNLADAGAYRVFTDIAPRALGKTITLGADLAVAGAYNPQPTPEPARTFTVDGYEVALDGALIPGEGRLLTLTVSKNGEPVTDLQPYLAAFGHLVVLRAGDLAYVHVHPNGTPGDSVTTPGPEITFHTAVPGPGTYRLFLDFKHADTVHTAGFTLRAYQS
ncbi:hypothetical protein [Nocardia pseudovaccinii]|uniref:hypothetical protein n=1 Tax=Nocardia pseudovaccinii TaxID=189540 RepID=UPI000AD5457D|nr:hypothetical protein [Nocardia pseudovaccinii]